MGNAFLHLASSRGYAVVLNTLLATTTKGERHEQTHRASRPHASHTTCIFGGHTSSGHGFQQHLDASQGALRAAWSLVFISLTYPQHLQRFGMELAPAQIAMLT